MWIPEGQARAGSDGLLIATGREVLEASYTLPLFFRTIPYRHRGRAMATSRRGVGGDGRDVPGACKAVAVSGAQARIRGAVGGAKARRGAAGSGIIEANGKGRKSMNLNDLLHSKNIDPRQVIVLRHRPKEPKLNKWLPLLAAEKPGVFNAYQQTQGDKLQKVMQGLTGVGYIASFIGQEGGKALFVGLYSITAARPLTYEEYFEIPANRELQNYTQWYLSRADYPASLLWFDLDLVTAFYAAWKGRLIVKWPPPELVWWRWADRNEMDMLAILEESALTVMPKWDEISFTWDELRNLPAAWWSKLEEWRVLYYIFDDSDGKGYVGSAYGANNLRDRWQNYAASGHGGNRLLQDRDPSHFHFTILERVTPDMKQHDIVALEASWKRRLHTRDHGLNDN